MADNTPKTNTGLNTWHISDNLAHYEHARSAFFVFQVAPDQLENLVHPDFDTSSGEATGNDRYNRDQVSDYLRLNVLKASVPSFRLDTHTYRRGNDVVKSAKAPEFKDGSIVVDDVVGLRIKDMLYAWLYLAYDPHTRKGGRMKDYKKSATLIEYTQDYVPIRKWEIEGCFITEIQEDDFDRENDEVRKMTVSISYDRAIMQPIYEDENGIPAIESIKTTL